MEFARIARLLKAASDAEGGEGTYALHVEAGPIVAFLCQGGAPTLDRLVQGAVEQVVKPLQLEATLKELPRYYEAIVATADWQKKFSKIMGEGEYPSIQRGKIFHIAGFPEIGDKPYYTAAMEIELKDDTMYLSEWDASAEGWLYSFWMRRWREGTMENRQDRRRPAEQGAGTVAKNSEKSLERCSENVRRALRPSGFGVPSYQFVFKEGQERPPCKGGCPEGAGTDGP